MDTSIILFDRSPIVATRISRHFEKSNSSVVQAKSIEEAELLIKENQDAKLLIMDIHLDQIDGLKLLEYIHGKYKRISIMVLTDIASRSMLLKSLKAGAEDYMLKPFDEYLLEKRIKTLLEKKQKEKADDDIKLSMESLLKKEIKKAQKGKYELMMFTVVIFIPVKMVTAKLEQQYQNDLQKISSLFESNLFETDLIFPYGSQSFIGALPFCSAEHFNLVKNKLTNAFEQEKRRSSKFERYQIAIAEIQVNDELNDLNDIYDTMGQKVAEKIEKLKEKI